MLLKIAGIARSVYYYYINKKDIDEKNIDIIEKIKEIYYANKGRYGYRRVTLELKNQGFNINHKKVQRLMKKLNLQSIICKLMTISRETLKLQLQIKNGLQM